MRPGSAQRRFTLAWLACLAILYAGLLPAMARPALLFGGDSLWLELCGAAGAERISLNASDDSPASGSASGCLWCSQTTPMPAQLPLLPATPPATAAPTVPLSLALPPPSPDWPAALPRAPPLA